MSSAPSPPDPARHSPAVPAPSTGWRRVLRRLAHLYWRFARPMTLGVRAAILHPDKGVFLVKHSYVAGWHLPGGGVEAGETIVASMAREVEEEANIVVTGEPVLHGVFFNVHASRRDHVVVYVVRTFTERGPRLPDREIVEASFFPLDGLPDDTTRGTRERLDEIAGRRPLSPTW